MTEVRSFPLHVHYGQAYLVDLGADGYAVLPMADKDPDHTVGILRTTGPECDGAFLVTGLHTGLVGFTAAVAATDPGADLAGYEDVVELSVRMPRGRPAIVEWAGEGRHELPPLPAGPGWYRLRYHARGFDAGQELDTPETDDEPPVDSYLLQIWPAEPSPPAEVRVVSEGVRYWLDN